MMNDDNTNRLNRIERKLDDVGTAIVSLARMEERMITLFKRMDTYDSLQIDITKRVVAIEIETATGRGSSFWVNKVIWVIIVAGLGTIFVLGR